MKKNIIQIREFDSLTTNSDNLQNGVYQISSKSFNLLENAILKNTNNKNQLDLSRFLSISVKNGIKVITARNFVGVIELKDGTVLEILPKLENVSRSETISIFMRMLKDVRSLPFKNFNLSNLGSTNLNLYEIFIGMFLNELSLLIKRGLKYDYILLQDNNQFIKGKILFNQNLKENLFHKERFYTQFDDFNSNRIENRLIKATLLLLLKKSKNYKNRNKVRNYLSYFEEVKESKFPKNDFSKLVKNQNLKEYERILRWCKIFLLNKSFNPFVGNEIAFALLFPMERLFEDYIASLLVHSLPENYKIKLQDQTYFLFDEPEQFRLRPDIVIKNSNQETIILDTKWKRIKQSTDISQSDMYQMFTYSQKYKASKVILVYPYIDSNELSLIKQYKTFGDSPVNIELFFFDLLNYESSLKSLINLIKTKLLR